MYNEQPSLQDTTAVTPVIGVILMVAITVILSSVIGVAVLSQVQDMSDSDPLVIFSATHENSTATITHTGGEDLDSDQLEIIVSGTATVSQPFTGTVEPGDRAVVTNLSDGEQILVVWSTGRRGKILFRTTHR